MCASSGRLFYATATAGSSDGDVGGIGRATCRYTKHTTDTNAHASRSTCNGHCGTHRNGDVGSNGNSAGYRNHDID